jgi:hypothetical protein
VVRGELGAGNATLDVLLVNRSTRATNGPAANHRAPTSSPRAHQGAVASPWPPSSHSWPSSSARPRTERPPMSAAVRRHRPRGHSTVTPRCRRRRVGLRGRRRVSRRVQDRRRTRHPCVVVRGVGGRFPPSRGRGRSLPTNSRWPARGGAPERRRARQECSVRHGDEAAVTYSHRHDDRLRQGLLTAGAAQAGPTARVRGCGARSAPQPRRAARHDHRSPRLFVPPSSPREDPPAKRLNPSRRPAQNLPATRTNTTGPILHTFALLMKEITSCPGEGVLEARIRC